MRGMSLTVFFLFALFPILANGTFFVTYTDLPDKIKFEDYKNGGPVLRTRASVEIDLKEVTLNHSGDWTWIEIPLKSKIKKAYEVSKQGWDTEKKEMDVLEGPLKFYAPTPFLIEVLQALREGRDVECFQKRFGMYTRYPPYPFWAIAKWDVNGRVADDGLMETCSISVEHRATNTNSQELIPHVRNQNPGNSHSR